MRGECWRWGIKVISPCIYTFVTGHMRMRRLRKFVAPAQLSPTESVNYTTKGVFPPNRGAETTPRAEKTHEMHGKQRKTRQMYPFELLVLR